MSLDPEVKQTWTTALRSGKFPQTHERLVDEKGYCCLGVLAQTCMNDKEINGWRWEPKSGFITPLGNCYSSGYLPGNVRHRYKIDQNINADEVSQILQYYRPNENHEVGELVYSYMGFLVYLNDEICLTFDEIADVIDNYL